MQKEITKSKRAKPIHITNQQKWQIAKYCIESKSVTVGTSGKFDRFRVIPKIIAEEINGDANFLLSNTINEYHVKQSLTFYNEIAEFTDNLPKIPPQDNALVSELQEKIEYLSKLNARYMHIITKIHGLCECLPMESKK